MMSLGINICSLGQVNWKCRYNNFVSLVVMAGFSFRWHQLFVMEVLKGYQIRCLIWRGFFSDTDFYLFKAMKRDVCV